MLFKVRDEEGMARLGDNGVRREAAGGSRNAGGGLRRKGSVSGVTTLEPLVSTRVIWVSACSCTNCR